MVAKPVRRLSEVAAADAAQAAVTGPVETVTLSTGIVLRLRPVPPRILADAATRVPKPEVPVVFITSRERNEANPDDPAYQAALAEWTRNTTDASFKLGLILGTAVEHIPDGYYPPESDDWINEIEAAFAVDGRESPVRREPEKARYLDWLLYHALGNDEDQFVLTSAMWSATLVTQEALAAAIESFRRLANWRINSEPAGDAGST